MGALKRLDRLRGEIKSMRVADAWLGKGVGRAMLDHIICEARRVGLTSLWLETGSSASFAPEPAAASVAVSVEFSVMVPSLMPTTLGEPAAYPLWVSSLTRP